MLKEKNFEKRSKLLAFLLRHDKNYDFKDDGWREVSDIIKNHGFTRKKLEDIVVLDDKGRYEFSFDKKRIRARHGHSLDVQIAQKKKTPPDVLYHGTATRFLDKIYNEGLMKMTRQYVHLSPSRKLAVSVGIRHGKPALIYIDSKRMSEDGIDFFLSDDNVWLVEHVDPKYFIQTEIENVEDKYKDKRGY